MCERKPILTTSNKRNVHNHPEFLDTETLLERFNPLIKAICKHFCSYDGMFTQPSEVEDLYNQTVLEFLNLRRSFDPKRGVDFPGFIKFHLQQKVYHWVMKQQKLSNTEQLVNDSEDNDECTAKFENTLNLVDEETEIEMEKSERLASIPWDKLSNRDKSLVTMVLIEHKSLEDIAKLEKVTVKSVRRHLDMVCNRLINIHNDFT